jgi:Zn-dependent protease
LHFVPQAPQLFGSTWVSLQVEPHCVVPPPHEAAQAPFEQIWPALQAVPQAPQFVLSFASEVQLSPQTVEPAPQTGPESPVSVTVLLLLEQAAMTPPPRATANAAAINECFMETSKGGRLRRFGSCLQPCVSFRRVTENTVTPEMMAVWARTLAFSLIPMMLSLAVHEYAHARVAKALGDDTPEREGRLTLNPLEHADPWGTFAVPAAMAILGGVALFGWAKPTRVRADMLDKRVPFAMTIVTAAGPLANACLAVLAALATRLAMHFHVPLERLAEDAPSTPTPLGMLLRATLIINVGLALVNLVPIPPLDGARLVPRFLGGLVRPLEQYGLAILIIGFFLLRVGQVIVGVPVMFAAGALMSAFGIG